MIIIENAKDFINVTEPSFCGCFISPVAEIS